MHRSAWPAATGPASSATARPSCWPSPSRTAHTPARASTANWSTAAVRPRPCWPTTCAPASRARSAVASRVLASTHTKHSAAIPASRQPTNASATTPPMDVSSSHAGIRMLTSMSSAITSRPPGDFESFGQSSTSRHSYAATEPSLKARPSRPTQPSEPCQSDPAEPRAQRLGVRTQAAEDESEDDPKQRDGAAGRSVCEP